MGEVKYTKDTFLLGLSVVYLFAFSSLYYQIPGLYGDKGILPARLLLKRESKSLEQCIAERPTLLWFAQDVGLDTQRMMELICLGGITISFLCLLSHRIRDTVAFTLLWVFYFSLYQVGQTFLWFQWDILLLETGFLAILVAPFNVFRWKSMAYNPHDSTNLWLVRWLLFRLMFASGIVKLTSKCPTWWGLTALQYHFQSQCIPTPFAWFTHHLPKWILQLGVVGTFFVEIPVSFLFFSPVRSLRLFSFYCQVFFQVMIIITGNYNFFNLLTIVLCVSLLDDEHIANYYSGPIEIYMKVSNLSVIGGIVNFLKKAFQYLVYIALAYWTIALFTIQLKPNFTIQSRIAFTPKEFSRALEKVLEISIWIGVISLSSIIVNSIYRSLVYEEGLFRKFRTLIGSLVFGIIAFGMFGISLIPLSTLHPNANTKIWPILREWHDSVDRYQLVNPYGLFRQMTGVGGRPEVVVEGANFISDSGWQEYEFHYKPGRLDTCPPFAAPHQPRLDWQMWFAALGDYKSNQWFINFMYRLLNNQKDVIGLLSHNPFQQQPPKYVRATLYTYKFTAFRPKKKPKNPHHWWSRKKVGEYMPPFSKENKTIIEQLKSTGVILKKSSTPPVKKTYLGNAIQGTRTYITFISAPTFLWSLVLTALTIRSLSGFDPPPTRIYC